MSVRDMLMAAAGVDTGGGSDTNFKNVTLLLNGDGTNGAQNNTFLDSSSNAFSITRNGNTTQGSFSPYGNLWSNYFDGSGDYLAMPSNSAFAFGTGDFTIEMFVYHTSLSGQQTYYSDTFGDTAGVYFYKDTSNFVGVYYNSQIATANTAIVGNQWNHIAVSRLSGTLRIFLNGTQVASVSNSTDLTNTNANIGGVAGGSDWMNGYISNVRVLKGTGYSSITVPTAPLTAISGTSLLTCQSNRFIDNSSNAFSITANGTPSVQRFSPFNPTASYDTATIGGSGYLATGGSDYLTVASNSAFCPGTSAFCVEFWYNKLAYGGNEGTMINTEVTGGLIVTIAGGGIALSQRSTGNNLQSSANPIAGQWNHIVACRDSSNNTAIFLNGVRVASGTVTANYATGSLYVGDLPVSGYWATGYYSDVRIVKGSTPYDPTQTTLTVPTAPLTAISNTGILLSMTNAGIPDSAMINDLETVGNAQVSTSVKKYGTGSIAFDGDGDYLLSPDKQASYFGTGNFTLECWLKTSSTSSFKAVLCPATGFSTSGFYNFIVRSDNTIAFEQGDGSTLVQSTTQVTDGNWHHVAVCRSGTTTRMFVDGVLEGTLNSDTYSYGVNSVGFYVGTYKPSIYNFNGYIDDLRITKGYARYTANFTPPTAALPVK